MKRFGLVIMTGLLILLTTCFFDRGSAVPIVNWKNDNRSVIEDKTAYMVNAMVNSDSEAAGTGKTNEQSGESTIAAAAAPAAVKPDLKASVPPAAVKKTSSSTEKKTAAPTAAEAPKKSSPAPAPSRGKLASSGSVIKTARKYLGVPYVYGGESPKGFDCSGFTRYVFDKFGVDLPRTAQGQSSVGTKITRSDLSPGDLVFFNTERSGSINHVGIYAGGNQFIHASRTKGITITSMDDSYYKNSLVTSRRVIR